MRSSSTLTIDLAAVQHNIRFFQQKGAVMAMVKANAYGVGALPLIPHLEKWGVTKLGVSHVQEGVFLRDAGVEMPIFVICAPPSEAHLVAKYSLEVAVSTLEEIETHAPLTKLHLQVNTGMNRFGIDPESALHLTDRALEGVMTHFASADIPDLDPYTADQVRIFEQFLVKLASKPPYVHAANTPAALRLNLPFCNMVRIGVGMFGYGFPSSLKPALTWETHLVYSHTRKKGEAIGYQCAYKAPREMTVGIIPVGYHDGLHRHYKESGHVLIHGKRAPLVGNICMDFAFIDLTDIPEAHIGDTVTLFDQEHLSPETVATWGNTDVRELTASIGPRTKRVYDEQRLRHPLSPIEKNSPSRKHLLPS